MSNTLRSVQHIRGQLLLVGVLGLLLGTAKSSGAQTLLVLHGFTPGGTDGYWPESALVMDARHSLYGTTTSGGTGGWGTVYKVDQSGTETILFNFTGGADGGLPTFGSLAIDKAGNLYGATIRGGAAGVGTVFKLTPTGVETVLHSFGANGTDGTYPDGGVVIDRVGNLYGTTSAGGAHNFGTVFKVSPTGTETVLYSFAGGNDGCYPYHAGVALGKKGALYGVTQVCGANSFGTVFKVSPDGTETVLHSFINDGSDGFYPLAGVALDKAGNVYGTTANGGTYAGGTVFKITSLGTETLLHSFARDGIDGNTPYGAALILDKVGNLYGTTQFGGTQGSGIVFELTSSGSETVLHSFGSFSGDAAYPHAGLIRDRKGNVYGTTYYGGGPYEDGAVFKLVP